MSDENLVGGGYGIAPDVAVTRHRPSRHRVNKYKLQASICRDSFYRFVQMFWHEIIPEKPVWNWHLKYLCDELQYVAERVFAWWCRDCGKDLKQVDPYKPLKACTHCGSLNITQGKPKEYDLIVNVPPGSTKSTIVSVMFPPWTHTRMPWARHIGGAFAANLTFDLGRRSKDLYLSDTWKRVFPELTLRRDTHGKGYFINTLKGSVRRTTVGSVIIGEHAHFLEVDDPLDPEGARSDAELETANGWVTETISQRKVDQQVAVMILVMQRLHQNDPTGFILKKHEDKPESMPIKHICLPAKRNKHVSPPSRRRYYGTHGLLDPVRLPQAVLTQKEDLGAYMYAGQYDQHPVPRSGGMFKTDRILLDTPPVLTKFADIVRYWDKGATKDGGAYTAGVKVAKLLVGKQPDPLNPKKFHPLWEYWILHCERGQWDTYEREEQIDQTAKIDGTKVRMGIENEGGSTGKDIALMTIQRHSGNRISMHSPTGDKEARADPVSVQVNGRNVKIASYGDDRDAWIHPFLEELKLFPKSTYKDQVDALSGAFDLLWKRKTARSF